MGDIAAIAALSNKFPERFLEETTLITYDKFVNLSKKISTFKKIIPFYKEDIKKTVNLCNDENFDLLIDLHSSSYVTSENAVFLNQINAKKMRITDKRLFLLSKEFHSKVEIIKDDKVKSCIKNVEQYLHRIGLKNDGIFNNDLSLNYNSGSKKRSSTGRPLIGIVPCSEYKHKQWPILYWEKLIHKIQDCDVAILCADFEIEKIKHLEKIPHVKIMAVTKPEEHLDNILCCDLIVSIDSGLKHLAAYLGKKVISLYSSGDHKIWGTFKENEIVNHSTVPCYPCNSSYFCLMGKNICLQQITPDRIYNQIKELGFL